MAKGYADPAPNPFKDLVGALEEALIRVEEAKAQADKDAKQAAASKASYDGAVKAAQDAHRQYQAHVNEKMSGFAQLHQ